MKKQLELLIKLHDLDLLLKEYRNPETVKKYKKLGFKFMEPSVEVVRARQELCQHIDPKLLAAYERIMKRYGDRALVPVVNEFCGGCYSKLPAELVTHQSELLTCPNCGRFLYWIK
jgi:predicted  nucleic acid-binding Zn-ribbon protein